MPTILDPGTTRLSNADVLDWIHRKQAQHASEAADDKSLNRKKAHLADNYQRALRKHARELGGRKYPYSTNPGAYSGENRIRAVSVFSERLDERILYPAEEKLRVESRMDGVPAAEVEKKIRREQDVKGLTETEHLQIFNLAPQCVETLQNIVVDWEERFSAEEMEVLLECVNEVYRCGERLPGGEEGMEGVEDPRVNGNGGAVERLIVSQAGQSQQNLPDRGRERELEMHMQILNAISTRISKNKRAQDDDDDDDDLAGAYSDTVSFFNEHESCIQQPQTRTPQQRFNIAPHAYPQDPTFAPRHSTAHGLVPQHSRAMGAQMQTAALTPIPTRRFIQEQRLFQAGSSANLPRVDQSASIDGQIPTQYNSPPQGAYSTPRYHDDQTSFVPRILQTLREPPYQRSSALDPGSIPQANLTPLRDRTYNHQPYQQPQHFSPPPPPASASTSEPHPCSPPHSPSRSRSLSPYSKRLLRTYPRPTPGPGSEEARRKASVEQVDKTGFGRTKANAVPVGVGNSWDDQEQREGGEGVWLWVPKKRF